MLFLRRSRTSLARLTALAVIALFYASPARTAELVTLEASFEGKNLTTYIQSFDESPLENPELISQIQELGVDHVAIVGELPATADRAPSEQDEISELEQKIETQTEIPVVRVEPPKGFFNKMRKVWDLSFKHPARVAGKADYRYGIVSTVGEAGPFAVMVLTTQGVAIENAMALVAIQTVLSYYTNVWNNGFNHFLESSFKNIGQTVKERTFFLRKFSYEYLTSQIFKLVQNPANFLSASVQSNIAMNTLMVGAGDVLISNSMYHAYHKAPEKLAKMNFYVNALSNVLGALDLIQHAVMPVIFNVHSYEFRLSGAILIGYYAVVNQWIRKDPEGIYRYIDRLDRQLKTAGKWFQARYMDCKRLFRGGKSKEPGQTAQLFIERMDADLESVIVRELFGFGRPS